MDDKYKFTEYYLIIFSLINDYEEALLEIDKLKKQIESLEEDLIQF